MQVRTSIVKTLALGTAIVAGARADVTTVTEYSVGDGQAHKVRMLRKNAMQRTEAGDKQAVITREDSIIILDLAGKTYTRIPAGPKTENKMENPEARKGGVVRSRIAVEDTGERKDVFGRKARRLKIRTETDADANACQPGQFRTETDGWYVDFDPKLMGSEENPASGKAAGGCQDRMETEFSGAGKPGFPIEYRAQTWRDGEGPDTMVMKVVELSDATIDPSLFEIPAGFGEKQSAAPSSGILVGVAPAANGAPGINNRLAGLLQNESVSAIALTGSSLEDARKASVEYLLTTEQSAEPAKKSGGMFGRLAKSMSGPSVELRYRLTLVKEGKTVLESTATGQNGGSGFAAAVGMASMAAPMVGAATRNYAAQSIIQSATHSFLSRSAGSTAQMGLVDPNLQSLAHMSYYSPGYAGAAAAGMAAGAIAASSNGAGNDPSEFGGPVIDSALQQEAKAVVRHLQP